MINAATLSQVPENKEVVAASLPEGLLQSWKFALPVHFGFGEKDHKRLPTLDLTAPQSVVLCDVPKRTFKKLQAVEGARMKYNSKKRTLRLYHDQREVEELICLAKVRDQFSRQLSYTIHPVEFKIPQGICIDSHKDFGRFASSVRTLVEEGFNRLNGAPILRVRGENCLMPNELITQSEGLVVGEIHEHRAPKKWLIRHADYFCGAGVDTLFVEHVNYDTMQPLLDAWQNNPKKPSPLLKRVLKTVYPSSGFYKVLKAYNRKGVRIVAIDTTLTYHVGDRNCFGTSDRGLPYRMLALSVSGKEIVEREKKGKYLMFVGSAHVSTCAGVPGLAELLHLPSVVVEEGEEFALEWNKEELHQRIAFVSAFLQFAR